MGWRKVCRVEEDVWGGGKCVGWRKEGGGRGGKCVGWRKEREDVRRCTGWREEGELCMSLYSDLSQLNPVRLGIQCCACGMD